MIKQLYRFRYQLTVLLITSHIAMLTGCSRHLYTQVRENEYNDDYTLPKHKLNTTNAVHFKQLRVYAHDFIKTDEVPYLFTIFYPDGRVKTFSDYKSPLNEANSGGFYKIENEFVKLCLYDYKSGFYEYEYINYKVLESYTYLIPVLDDKLRYPHILEQIDARDFLKEDVIFKGSWKVRE